MDLAAKPVAAASGGRRRPANEESRLEDWAIWVGYGAMLHVIYFGREARGNGLRRSTAIADRGTGL